MPLPLAANSTKTLALRDSVMIIPEFQDAGDDQFLCLVIEVVPNHHEVKIAFYSEGRILKAEWIAAKHLNLLS